MSPKRCSPRLTATATARFPQNEAAAYAELLKRDLTLRLDGRKLKLKLTASEFSAPAELRSGWGIIQMEFSATPGPLAAGAHKLTLENRHLPAMSVYLINAAQPRSGTIQITRQKRNDNQSAGEIEFTFHPLRPKVAESGARGLKMDGEKISRTISALLPTRSFLATIRNSQSGGTTPGLSGSAKTNKESRLDSILVEYAFSKRSPDAPSAVSPLPT